MSTRIDQLQFWTRIPTPKDASLATTEGGPGGGFLSYHVLLGLTVLGGFFALDHLYLRSPLTFFAKILVNVFFFGVWWLFDASQIIFNRDVTKVFGLSVPILGPKGIGAGSLASEVPDKKHMAFFYYALAVLFGGLFGLDSFLVGNNRIGLFRLLCTIIAIFIPISLGIWGYQAGRFLFFTKDAVDANWEYFGAPQPAEEVVSVLENFISQIPVVGNLFGFAKKTEQAVDTLVGTATRNPGLVTAALKTVVDSTIAPVTRTVESLAKTAEDAVGTVKTAVNSGTQLTGQALNIVGDTTEAATKALQLVPGAVAVSQAANPGAVQAAVQAQKALQQGGAQESMLLPYVFLGTIGIIAVSGLALSYLRSRQNEPATRPRKDDAPPEPGVLRKSD